MARRVIVRSRNLNTSIARLEQQINNGWKTIWKDHLDDLKDIATYIEEDAKDLVPVDTGKLKESIHVWVSGSNRWQYLIAQATAKNIHRTGFDYALIQEENESYEHTVGQAHYLAQPFIEEVQSYFESIGGNDKLWIDGDWAEDIYNYQPKQRRP